jgi:CubicO group peptidase (beta-lactamase class C family)
MIRHSVLAAMLFAGAGCARSALPPRINTGANATITATTDSMSASIHLAEPLAAVETFTDPDRRGKLAATFPTLDAYLAGQQIGQGLPGLVFGVVIDGELAYQKGFGVRDVAGKNPPDADTVYRIGSVTKTFTSAAILKLRDEGKLSLDAPAVRYLPELGGVKYPTGDSPSITLRHLLTHASGLPRVGPFNYAQADHDVTERELLGGLASVSLEFPPGTKASYSNFGFGLLGVVVSRVAAVRYRDYVSAAILAPLGMSSTRWAEGDVPVDHLATAYQRGPAGLQKMAHWRLGASEAAGGLYSSLRDMARYAAFQLTAYPPRNDRDQGPLRRSSLREAHVPQRPTGLSVTVTGAAKNQPQDGKGSDDRPLIEADADGIGLAWHGRQTCQFEQIVDHAGGTEGYAALIRLLPQRGVGIVALTNVQSGDLAAIGDGALQILNQSGALDRRSFTVSPALARAVAAAAALYTSFRDPDYQALFAPAFRAGVPSALALATIAQLKSVHGQCQDPQPVPISIESPSSAVFLVPCQRGSLAYDVSVGADGRITSARVESHPLPSPVPGRLSHDRCHRR